MHGKSAPTCTKNINQLVSHFDKIAIGGSTITYQRMEFLLFIFLSTQNMGDQSGKVLVFSHKFVLFSAF